MRVSKSENHDSSAFGGFGVYGVWVLALGRRSRFRVGFRNWKKELGLFGVDVRSL